jgi:hypothetical protein
VLPVRYKLGFISQKTALFIVIAMKAPNITRYTMMDNDQNLNRYIVLI